MKSKSITFSMTLALIPILCQAQVSEEQKALDSFRSLVRHHVDSYKPNGREHVTKLGGGWAKEQFSPDPASVKFDVEKTSSLVSPFIGTLTFTLTRNLSDFHLTETEAAADTVFIKRDTSSHKHVFAYQDHEWQPTSRQHRSIGSLADGYYPCDELLLKREKPSEKDVHGCLEEFDGYK
jgi:hypothetical protein